MSRPTPASTTRSSCCRRPKRDAIVAVWDFCRAVDDTVDERSRPVMAQVQRRGAGHAWPGSRSWRCRRMAGRTGRCFPARRRPQGQALQPFIRQFNLSAAALRRPDRRRRDGSRSQPLRRRSTTLYEYCWRVASTVGLICIEIFGCTRPDRAHEYAVHLGVALQLTNIIRDVATTSIAGGSTCRRTISRASACTEADLAAGRPVRSVHDAARVRVRLALASTTGKAAALLPREDAKRLVAAEIMAGIYRETSHSRSNERGYDVFSQRHPRAAARRAVIAATDLAAIAGRTRCRVLTSSSLAADLPD